MKRFAFIILFFFGGIVLGGALVNFYNSRVRMTFLDTYLTSLRTPPYRQDEDPTEYLSALVAQERLKYVDIVFPNVPYNSKEAYTYWKKVCEENIGIAYSFVNPSYVGFEPRGKQPFHLCVWFKPDSQKVVKELVKFIDEKYSIKDVVGEHRVPVDENR